MLIDDCLHEIVASHNDLIYVPHWRDRSAIQGNGRLGGGLVVQAVRPPARPLAERLRRPAGEHRAWDYIPDGFIRSW
jgi:hypothetical protein